MKKIVKAAVVIMALVVLGTAQGCVSVKAYQKMYLNDEDMALRDRKIELTERNAESYREGAAGGNGGKVGGGCGCN